MPHAARQTRSRPCPTCGSIMSTSVIGQAKHMAACETKSELERAAFRANGEFPRRKRPVNADDVRMAPKSALERLRTDTVSTSAEQITAIRAALGLTVNRFAYRLGVGTKTVRRWEAGEVQPPEPELRLARATLALQVVCPGLAPTLVTAPWFAEGLTGALSMPVQYLPGEVTPEDVRRATVVDGADDKDPVRSSARRSK